MTQTPAEIWHWQRIALYLAALSLIPTAIVAYAAIYADGASSTAWSVASIALFTASAGGMLWAFAAAAKTFSTERPRSWALLAMRGFAVSAAAMCIAGVARIGLSIAG